MLGYELFLENSNFQRLNLLERIHKYPQPFGNLQNKNR